jgi:hypothetical protein
MSKNEETVFRVLAGVELNDAAIAGIMGNIKAESSFRTELRGYGGAGGICQWEGLRQTRLKECAEELGFEVANIVFQIIFMISEMLPKSRYRDVTCGSLFETLKDLEDTEENVEIAADFFNALFERNRNRATWEDVLKECQRYGWNISRFSEKPNAFNGRYYLDAPKRRGAAMNYYKQIKDLRKEREENNYG